MSISFQAMVDVDGSSLHTDSQAKSDGLVTLLLKTLEFPYATSANRLPEPTLTTTFFAAPLLQFGIH